MRIGQPAVWLLTRRVATSADADRVDKSLWVWGKESDVGQVYRLRVIGVLNGFMRLVGDWRLAVEPTTSDVTLVKRAGWRAW